MENIGQNSLIQLDDALSRLARMSLGLRYNGLLVFLFSLANLTATSLLLSRYADNWDRSTLRMLPLWACLAALLCLALYEYFRRQGNVLFDEISD